MDYMDLAVRCPKKSPLNLMTHFLSITDPVWSKVPLLHNNDVIMSVMASQITSLAIVYSTIYSGADQRKH